ncbi:MAG TPA: FAD-dependent oxidoreductase [Caulobacteraceae bacterium]
MAERFDVLIVGGGIAGASLGAGLAAQCSVAIIERESRPGYHATGRSAALFSELYGNPAIRALSRASRAFLFDPAPDFCETALVFPRGALYVARGDQLAALETMAASPGVSAGARLIDGAEARNRSPLLRPGYAAGGIFEPDARDIDVDALHQGYLRQFRAEGGRLLLDTELRGLDGGGREWLADTSNGTIAATVVVNAAGAWAEQVGAMAGAGAIGLTPRRRTALLVDAPDGPAIAASPATIDIDEQFYFKPDAGLLLLSPADETPSAACDARPDEMDIAIAIDRIETATTLQVRRVRSKWAGLRSFVDDCRPVVGFDARRPGFFWLAGQGGYGIQTAPAMGRLAAALVLRSAIPAELLDFGVDPVAIGPGRLARRAETSAIGQQQNLS